MLRVDASFFPHFSLIFTTSKRKQAANSNFCYCQQRHGETLGNNRQLFQETSTKTFSWSRLYQMEHNSTKYTLFVFILFWIFVCRTFFLFTSNIERDSTIQKSFYRSNFQLIDSIKQLLTIWIILDRLLESNPYNDPIILFPFFPPWETTSSSRIYLF